MSDTISQDNLLLDTNKIELVKTKNEKEMMQEQINVLQGQFTEVASMLLYERDVVNLTWSFNSEAD